MGRAILKDEFNKTFAENLRKQRKQGKETQGSMADKAGLSLRYVQDIEAGKKSPSIHTLAKLCVALNVPVDTLISPLIHLIKKP